MVLERFELPLPASGLLLDGLEEAYELPWNESHWEAAVRSSTTSGSFTRTSSTVSSTTTTSYILDQICHLALGPI